MRSETTIARWRAWLAGLGLGAVLTSDISAAAPGRDVSREVILTEAERAWVQQHPVVRCGLDPGWPPFSSVNEEGEISGIDVDIVNLVSKRAKLNVQWVKTSSWPETLRKAATGEIDFIGGIARTEQRTRMLGLQFTEVYCDFPTAIVTRKDMPFLTLVRELKSKRIVVPRDYATTEALMRLYPDAHVVLTDNEEQSMLFVAGDKADATVLNLASAGYVVHMRGLTNLKISGFTELDFFLSLGVRPGAPELRSILQKSLATISPREKEAIYETYISPEIRGAIDWKAWRRRAIYSALIGVGLFAAVFLWNRGLAHEIEHRKVVEAALVQTRDKLDAHAQELARRSNELLTLNEKLTWANQDLEAFSSSVSHDLKSPLRRIRIFAELLGHEGGSRLEEATRGHLNAIQRESERMGELVEALLKFARVGRAQVRVAPVKLEELVRETIDELKVETQQREILWDVHPLPEVSCDRGLIKQVLANLLSNAAKFTRGRNPARIEIGVLPQQSDNEEVTFFVKDNGVGFETAKARSLFEGFHRLHRQEEFEGIGLGLVNVKRIIQKHGGRVWAEGEADHGATFYFSILNKKSPS
jgi:signal transduction histidine kinase